jgi:hypothetical protein
LRQRGMNLQQSLEREGGDSPGAARACVVLGIKRARYKGEERRDIRHCEACCISLRCKGVIASDG